MTVSFETRIPSGRARRRESICEALPPMKYESRKLVPRVKVRASIPKVSWRSGPTYAYEWSTALAPETPFTCSIRFWRPCWATAPGGAVTTTSAPRVSSASTRVCWL